LEAIDARHTDTVALLHGPVVLMAVKPARGALLPAMKREQLLAAKRVSERQWQVNSSNGMVNLLPFTSLGELPYTTYLKVS
jgi:hypothetical protein